ncbi:hypothetical protein HMPREF9946_04165 [Acetobacteraceae bacterium AT-5844]|nr:hypothetical protein HMPREF9946_04165 [Acetobacteraceae bacterium AT-5844]
MLYRLHMPRRYAVRLEAGKPAMITSRGAQEMATDAQRTDSLSPLTGHLPLFAMVASLRRRGERPER